VKYLQEQLMINKLNVEEAVGIIVIMLSFGKATAITLIPS